MSSDEHFEVTIPSDTSEGQAVQARIVEALEVREYPEKDVFSVRLALEEALVNAIKHGNRMSPDKSVEINCWISDERVRVEIQDEGEGFDRSHVPDPTLLENLERPCGRGIMLMGAFMNLIEYNEQGNKVILEKIKGVSPKPPDSEAE
ncbi:ATP-binding protein [Gimesia maris]|uniref:Anti-sigma F factor n=1 Tax=Gimesia maris TaxID=122 RepID=A0ABX5YST1_9PLAN|nr:ATP-binding protein [Gimesia maris]QDT81011.1 anti-sigma F factor [Gimesia maris]QDU16730.1 anti-sigma F factor [Gimesia maris]QEG18775.1 anti-sigma F factor [Gimesia maris]QGQ28300.1 ATP-binding protein [Gimesia maris]|tara:strand:+ start:39275 stop:39718 length:444 start_codon:yes stop_codon:yes gene_type:complete